MSTLWVSSLAREPLLRDHGRRSWLLSNHQHFPPNDAIHLLLHLQEPAAAVALAGLRLTQREQAPVPGLGRQGSQPGLGGLPRGAPSLSKSLSHTGAVAEAGDERGAEAEAETTVAALRSVRAQMAGENAWLVSLPLPFSLHDDGDALWGPDASPVVDKARLDFTIEVQSSQGGAAETHTCSVEIDVQCATSLVAVVAVLRSKCDAADVLGSCLRSTMQFLPWLGINDYRGVQSAFWLHTTIFTHFVSPPVYLAPLNVHSAFATFVDFLTSTSTVWGTSPTLHATMFVLAMAFEIFDMFGRGCHPTEVTVPATLYHLLQPLACSEGCELLRRAMDKKAAKDLLATTLRFAITEGLTFLRRADCFKLIPNFTSWAAVLPILAATDLGEKADISYADNGMFEKLAECRAQFLEGAGSRGIQAFIESGDLTTFSNFHTSNQLFVTECSTQTTTLRHALFEFRRRILEDPQWDQLYQQHFGATSLTEEFDTAFYAAHEAQAQLFEAREANRRLVMALEQDAVRLRQRQNTWTEFWTVKDLETFHNERTVISAVVGSGERGLDDGKPSLQSALNQPAGIVVLPPTSSFGYGDRYLICDSGNSRICMHSSQHALNDHLPSPKLTTLCGTGQGNVIGAWQQAKFFRPRAACRNPAHPDWLIVCDTNNHSIKLLNMTSAQVFNLTNATKPGFSDGNNACFRFPVDIAPFPANPRQKTTEYVICDRGNHALRLLELTSHNQAKVTTLAGGPNLHGFEDGRVAKAQLKAPVGAVVRPSDGCIFFVEQGNASIRMLADKQVTTLLAGAPLESPSCICFGDTEDVLLIGDSTAQVVWEFHIQDRSINPLLTAQDLPLVDDKEVFRPAALAPLGQGCFLVTDSTRHQMYRFFSFAGAADACARIADEHGAQQRRIEQLAQNIADLRRIGLRMVESAAEYTGKICSAKYRMICASLQATVPFHNTLCHRELLLADPITHLLGVLPSIEAASALLIGLRVPRNLAHIIRLALQGLCKRCSLVLPSVDYRQELRALYELRLSLGPEIVDQETLAAVLSHPEFTIRMDDATLQLLQLLLVDVRWSFDRNETGELRQAVIRWFARTYGSWSLARESHAQILSSIIGLWNDLSHKMREAYGSSYEDVLKWLMRVHMDSVMQGQVTLKDVVIEDGEEKETTRMLDRSLLTLEHVVFLSNQTYTPITLSVLIDEVSNVLGSVAPAAAMKAVLHSEQDFASCNGIVFNQLFQPALCRLMQGTYGAIMRQLEQALEVRRKRQQERFEKLQQKREREGKTESDEKHKHRLKEPDESQLTIRSSDIRQELLKESEMWGQAVHWVLSDSYAHIRDADHPIWPQLRQVAAEIAALFEESSQELLSGLCTVDAAKKLVQYHSHLRPIWEVLGSPLAQDEIITGVDSEMQNALVELQLLKNVLSDFMPESLELYAVHDAVNRWNQLKLLDYRSLLRLNSAFVLVSNAESAAAAAEACEPLPENTLFALDWLSKLTTSKAFGIVWESLAESTEANNSRVVPAAQAWRQLMLDLCSGELSFPSLDAFATHLVAIEELQLLLKTATAIAPEDNVFEVAATISPNVSQLHGQLQDWLHVRTVLAHEDDLLRTMQLLSSFVDEKQCAADIQRVTQAFIDLCQTVKSADWAGLKLNDLPRFWTMAQNVDPRLVRVSPVLLQAILEHKEAMDWLRLLANDTNFTNSLEMAFGKTEMECPIELWDDVHGRVDEQKLSILRNVRSYLHPYLYTATSHFRNLETFLRVFSSLNAAVEVDAIVQNIAVVHEYLSPLIAIITDDSETAGPNRLVHLYHPAKQARWVCRKSVTEHSQASSLVLQYLVTSRDGDARWQEHKLDELLDFQSSIVLARTSSMNAESVQEVIDRFLYQFSWVRQLAAVLEDLQLSGHFDFSPSYDVQLAVAVELATFKEEMAKHTALLREWETTIEQLRTDLYFLNFIGSAQLQTFARSIADNTLVPTDLRPVVCRVNCDLAHDLAFLEESVQHARSEWNSQQLELPEGTSSAVAQLIKAAHALNAVLARTPLRIRPVRLEITELADKEPITRGVHVALAASSREQYQALLTIYAQLGLLPEWKELLICQPDTSREQVMNFMRRWRGSGLLQQFHGYFMVLGVEVLPFDLQQLLSQTIRDFCTEAPRPLVLIGYNGITNHVVSQHMHNKLFVTLVPDEVLRHLGQEIGAQYSLGLAAYTSAMPGAGKTFEIRTRAHMHQLVYVNVPVHSDVKERTMIDRVTRNSALALDKSGRVCTRDGHAPRVLLHLDLSSPVTHNFNHMVFKLAFLGFVSEEASGACFVWDPRHTALMFELASGSLAQKVNVAALMENVVCMASPNTFRITAAELEIGMGEDFVSSRYDGSDGTTNACERLQYVAYALKLFDSLKGGFPYQYHGPTDLELAELDPALAFKHITEVSGQNDRPSLWCIWNFINVLYWQLKDLHHPESVLNTACMPDPSSHSLDDQASKQRIKGEILLFICRTAKEFATRQSKRVETGTITSVTVRSMSRVEFNGYWRRTGFDNDGQPCFVSKGDQYYLYYRRTENRWVIDDIIEPTGPVYSCSTTRDIHGRWTTSPSWQNTTAVRAELRSSPKGYRNEAIRIHGCASCGTGGSVSAAEDGLYIRQPPYDDINDRPHYIKEEPRRHLFYSVKESCWQISPVCNEDQGAYAMTITHELTPGRWRVIPPDIVEQGQSFVFHNSDAADPTAADDSAAQQALEGGMNFDLLRWQDSNHECVLFSNESHMVSFLSMNAKQMKSKMHPSLLRHLQQNNIVVGEELASLGARHRTILQSVTGVVRSKEETEGLMGGKYCLTGDNMLKMLAIYYRVRCGIPVVLMGECGCGKTMLISYLCAWLAVELLVLDVHGGTTERDILSVFERAEQIIEEDNARSINRPVYIFLDEVNTCAHMGLITEAICRRTLNGVRMNERIQVLAALNPYRLRADTEANQGLAFNLPGKESTPDPMSRLVYRVHPVPETLQEFIFDFGALETDTELLYIRSMVDDKLHTLNDHQRSIIADLVQASHEFVRAAVKDDSAVSLRDVKRFLQLSEWFESTLKGGKGSKQQQQQQQHQQQQQVKILPVIRACILALAHVYSYRLSSNMQRNSFWSKIRLRLKDWGKDITRAGFGHLTEPGALQTVVERAQRRFTDNLDVEDGIAMNQALMENLFVVIVCILNKIPVFVVGKPGSSKTLTMQVIASNLQGKQSRRAIWRQFPAVYIFQYQCSPLSTTASIKFQYDAAVSYQTHSQDVITVLLLDEVGLAEHSPDMPLKVLHYILVDPPISVVGLSNWELDPAKMNRAVCLQRPEPSPDDIMLTGSEIVNESGNALQPTPDHAPALIRQNSEGSRMDMKLKAIAEAFHIASRTQNGREFIGMRDYYQLLKLLRKGLKQGAAFDSALLTYAVCRNFGGKPKLLRQILQVFHEQCFGGGGDELQPTPVLELIRSNLESHDVRHLMLLTRNDTALSLLFGCGLVEPSNVDILVGSRFREDLAELHLVQQINQVKKAMAAGRTIVLLNHDNIYEALYDVLNQRYVFTTDEEGVTKKMLRLAVGPRSQLCPVQDSFKIIVIVDQSHAYDKLDLPLLNRFEKQLFVPQDLLGPSHMQLLHELSTWVQMVETETGLPAHKVFCGYYENTLPSLLLELTDYGQCVSFNAEAVLRAAKQALRRVAMPVAVMFSSVLQDTEFDYFEAHADLAAFLRHNQHTETDADAAASNGFWTLMTYSPVYHFESASHSWNTRLADGAARDAGCGRIQSIMLAELSSERHLARLITDFLQDSSAAACTTLAILADPATCPQALINHARHMCVQQYQHWKAAAANAGSSNSGDKSMLFVIHLPPGVANRARSFVLDFNRPWKYAFVDDLRPESDIGGPKVNSLLQQSVHELFTSSTLPLLEWVQEVLQSALVRCATIDLHTALTPDPSSLAHEGRNDPFLHSYFVRVSMLRLLMAEPTFFDAFQKALHSCFEFKSHRDRSGMHLHVVMACKDDSMAGSLRQSLHLAVQSFVSQAIAHVLRQLDKNANLSWLFSRIKANGRLDTNDPAVDLWLRLWRVMFDVESIGRTFVLVLPGDPPADFTVPNTSQFNPLVCQFPFSDQLIHTIGHPETRKQVETISRDVTTAASAMAAITEAIVGPDIVRQWSACFPSGHRQYLHDMIAISLHPCPYLSFELHVQVCEMLMSAVAGDFLASPAHIHAAFWASEQVIFHTLSLLSACEQFISELRPLGAFGPLKIRELMEQLRSALANECSQASSSMAARATTAAVHVVTVVVRALRNSLLAALTDIPRDDRLWLWRQVVRMVRSDLSNLLSYIASAENVDRDVVIQRALQPWWSVVVCDVVLREAHSVHLTESSTLDPALILCMQESLFSASLVDGLAATNLNAYHATSLEQHFMQTLMTAFINDCVSTELRRVANTPLAVVLDEEFFLALLRLAVRAEVAPPVPGSALEEDAALSKAVLAFFTATKALDISDTVRHAIFQSPMCSQLLMEQYEDLGVDVKESLSVAELLEVARAEDYCELLDRQGALAVAAILQLKRAITEYARTVVAALNYGNPMPTPPAGGVAQALLGVNCVPAAQHYFLNCIQRIGSMETLVTYFSQRQVPVLPAGCSLLSSNKGQTIVDPFPLLGPTYERAFAAVARIAAGSTADIDPFVDALTPDVQLAALFTQLVRQGGQIPPMLANRLVRKYHGAEARVLKWLMRGCPRTVKGEDAGAEEQKAAELQGSAMCQTQATFSAVLLSCTHSWRWLETFLTKPVDVNTMYLPSMVDDELATIIDAAGYVGWYKCPNGHPYSVGNCTFPMEQARCPVDGCGAQIGGQNHVAVAGVTRFDNTAELAKHKTGYDPLATLGAKSYDTPRGTLVSCQLLRFVIHSVMLVSATTESRAEVNKKNSVASLMFPDSRAPSLERACEEIELRRQQDWQALTESTGLTPLDMTLFIQLTLLERYYGTDCTSTPTHRLSFEHSVGNAASTYVGSAYAQERLAGAAKRFGDDSRSLLLLKSLGRVWNNVNEVVPATPRGDFMRARMWRYREPVSVETFQRWLAFDLHARTSYPLLFAILKEENKLPLIKHLVDVLAWHRVLFSIFRPGSISREEAATITNAEALARVPEAERPQAEAVFEAYCVAFNAAFPLVTNLYECQANPFLNKDGQVDLSGSGTGNVKMGPDTPISFSLPSLVHGDADASGLCTIQLVNTLQEAHNQLLETLQQGAHLADPFGGTTRRRRRGRYRVEEVKQADGEQARLQSLPVTTYLTPSTLVRSKLVDYDRATHLMPLLHAYVLQSPDLRAGALHGFDFAHIQSSLASSLLGSATPIVVHVRHFQFAGELRKTGGLRGLTARVPQEGVNKTILDNIWAEIDTQHRLTRLMSQLEECIAFVVSIGGSGSQEFSGRMKLEDFLLKVLLIDPARWEEIACPSLSQHISLCHLQALFMDLEERVRGSPADNVVLKYREQLEPELQRALLAKSSSIDLNVFIPLLREFMTEQLCTDTWPGDASLKEYLTYASEVDLEALDWFVDLPDGLQLRHAYATYHIVKNGGIV